MNLPLAKKRKSETEAAEQEGGKSAKTIAKANVRAALKGGKTGKTKPESKERNSLKMGAAAARFVDEEETEFQIEVEGQASEFMSDPEEENGDSDQRGSRVRLTQAHLHNQILILRGWLLAMTTMSLMMILIQRFQ